MQRFPDWAFRLDEFFRQHQQAQFRYGTWDCCLFVTAAIAAMTGEDPAEPFRGRYSSWKAALRAMKQACGDTSLAVMAARIASAKGMPEVPPLFAGRGDVVLLKQPRNYCLGLVALNGKEIVVLTRRGLERVPLYAAEAVRAWRV